MNITPHDAGGTGAFLQQYRQRGGMARALIGIGLFWFAVGMAAVPGHRGDSVYHWTLALVLFVPALWLLVREHAHFGLLWGVRGPLLLCAILLVWTCVTLSWAGGGHVAERMKAPLYAVLYLTAWMAWDQDGSRRTERVLYCSALGLALSALVAMVAFPWRDIVWTHRMVGFELLDGPNLSAYVMGAALVWLAQLAPVSALQRGLWMAALLVLAVFVAWTGSRGAWLALFASLVTLPLWRPGRTARVLAGICIGTAALVLILAPVELLHRGLSYRPQILQHAFAMIARHPWGGLGLGSKYQISVGAHSWTHSHNLFTNIAIESGLPALALWLVLWCWTGWSGWRHRDTGVGRIVLAVWVFASVALQFDGPSLLHSPRPEWLLTWLPLALAIVLWQRRRRMLVNGAG